MSRSRFRAARPPPRPETVARRGPGDRGLADDCGSGRPALAAKGSSRAYFRSRSTARDGSSSTLEESRLLALCRRIAPFRGIPARLAPARGSVASVVEGGWVRDSDTSPGHERPSHALVPGVRRRTQPADPARRVWSSDARTGGERTAADRRLPHLVRAHYHAEAAELPQAVAELRKALDRDPRAPHSGTYWHGGSAGRAPTRRRSPRPAGARARPSAERRLLTLARPTTRRITTPRPPPRSSRRFASPLGREAYETLARYAAERKDCTTAASSLQLPPGPAPARPRALPARPAGDRARSLGRHDPSSRAAGRINPDQDGRRPRSPSCTSRRKKPEEAVVSTRTR